MNIKWLYLTSATLACASVFVLTSCNFNVGSYQTEPSEQTLDIDVSAFQLKRIRATSANGAISFAGQDQSNIRVHAVKRVRAPTQEQAEAFLKLVRVRGVENDGEISIEAEHPKPPRRTSVTISYDIDGPAAVDVKLRSSNGKIFVTNASGYLETKSSNGKIHLKDISGTVNAETSNGAVEVDGVTMDGPMHLKTSNGAIRVVVRDGNHSVTAVTSNGAIDLTLPDGYAGTIAATTSNGQVNCARPVEASDTSRPKKKNRVEGVLGAGGESVVRLKSSNGTIHVR